MNFVVMLKTEYNTTNGVCQIGPDTSNDPDESDFAATLQLSFSTSTGVGGSAPVNYSGTASSFYTRIMNNAPGYILDLKSLAGSNNFCRIQVMPDTNPSNPNHSLIEGHVYIHMVTTSNQANTVKKPYVMFGQEQAGQTCPVNGWPTANVINRDIQINLGQEQEAYLFALVTYTNLASSLPGKFDFEVGDPRDNAMIEVSEV